MIALERIRTAEAIPKKYREKGKERKERILLRAQRDSLLTGSQPIEFDKSYWSDAKEQLKEESHGKCAYCEANTDIVAHGDVEHYRPKRIYWWLAYTYDNYLFACQICNQIYKNDNFPYMNSNRLSAPPVTGSTNDDEIELMINGFSPDPLNTNRNYTLNQYIQAHRAEKALLINPYLDDPSTYFAYSADDTSKEVEVIATTDEAQPYIDSAQAYYGINRIELKSLRYAIFTKFRAFKKAYSVISSPSLKQEIQEQIEDMLSEKYLFAGMNRYFNKVL